MSYGNKIKEAWQELAESTPDLEAQLADMKNKLQDLTQAQFKQECETGMKFDPGFPKAQKLEQIFADDIDEPQAVPDMPHPALKKKWPILRNPAPEEVLPPMDEDTARFMARREDEMLVFYPRKQNVAEGYGPDQTCALEPIQHFNVKDLLARFFVETHARYGEVANWRANCIGITSMYFGAYAQRMGGKIHMPIFDYDGKNVKTQIRKDVKMLQDQWKLGDAWIYGTRRGFHVYFFTDMVPWRQYHEMLENTHCCKGFKRAAMARGYAVLRVSAKYTEFDINFLYVLAAKNNQLRRMTRKAHMIRALLGLGTQCGTHFASMFPQWAHFQQDPKEWKPPTPNPTKGKKIRKVAIKKGIVDPGLVAEQPQLQVNEMPSFANPIQGQVKYVYAQGNGTAGTSSTTFTVNTNWYIPGNNTGGNQ